MSSADIAVATLRAIGESHVGCEWSGQAFLARQGTNNCASIGGAIGTA